MPASPYWFHPPGSLTRSAVLDIGLKCPHSCRFCYYSFLDGETQFKGLRSAGLRPAEQCVEIVRHFAQNAYLNYDITGGEPTIHPGLVDIIAAGSALGLTSRAITLGQFLRRNKGGQGRLLDSLLEAGLTDFLFSLHAVETARFANYTNASWDELRAVMDELDERGFQYSANTVVFAENLNHLPAIARESAKRGIYHHNFIMFNAFHQWDRLGATPPPQARFAEAHGPLCEALDILDEAGVAATVRYSHLCALPTRVRHVVGLAGLHHDPHEWINRAMNLDREPAYCAEPVHSDPDRERETVAIRPLNKAVGKVWVIAQRGDGAKVFPKRCRKCAAMGACDGIDPKYLTAQGDSELTPFAAMELRANLAAERLHYLPPFFLKNSPAADMRGLFARLATPWNPPEGALVTVVVEDGDSLPSGNGSYESGMEVIALPEGPDLASRRNAALKAASGQAICFLPASMRPAPGFAAEALQALRSPGVGFVQADIQLSGGHVLEQNEYGLTSLIRAPFWSGPTLMRRQAALEAGGYSSSVGPLLDWDLLLAGAEVGWFGARLRRAVIRAEKPPILPEADDDAFRSVVLARQRLFDRESVLRARNGGYQGL